MVNLIQNKNRPDRPIITILSCNGNERYHPLESEKIPLSSGWYRSLRLQLKIVNETKFNRETFLININREK